MRKFLYSILILTTLSCSTSGNLEYRDHEDRKISKTEYDNRLRTRKFLQIPGVHQDQKRLISRDFSGALQSRRSLDSILETSINRNIDHKKPLVVIYWPGEDRCNSSVIPDKKNKVFSEMQQGITKITGIKPVFLYNNPSGLSGFKEGIDWQKDPSGLFESHFFPHHSPCWSFLVISSSGEFVGYRGEFRKELLYNTVRYFQNE